MPASLSDQVNAQLRAAYEMIKTERFGMSYAKAGGIVLDVLPEYMLDLIFKRSRSSFSQPQKVIARFHYIRATALWHTGKKNEARAERDKAGAPVNCDEREMMDGWVKND